MTGLNLCVPGIKKIFPFNYDLLQFGTLHLYKQNWNTDLSTWLILPVTYACLQ